MRVIHTSDWHLGKQLYKKSRYEEMEKFLAFLIDIIKKQKIDIVLISGDIFDNGSPSNRAKKLYYNFLLEITKLNVSIVVTSGNHDSPSFLAAPSELLESININIVTESKVIELKDKAIVCAIPYLREQDLINISVNDDRVVAITQAIANHYKDIFNKARELQKINNLPIFAMGHLTMLGSSIREGQGEREIYIGNELGISTNIIDEDITYTALGHIHKFQQLGNRNIYYSGTPIPMNFGEPQDKKLVIIDEKGNIETVDIPTYQRLEQIKGNKEIIFNRLEVLSKEDENIWVEIESTEDKIIPETEIKEIYKNSKLEVLRITSPNYVEKILQKANFKKELKEIDHKDIFEKVIENEDGKEELRELYNIAYTKVINKESD